MANSARFVKPCPQNLLNLVLQQMGLIYDIKQMSVASTINALNFVVVSTSQVRLVSQPSTATSLSLNILSRWPVIKMGCYGQVFWQLQHGRVEQEKEADSLQHVLQHCPLALYHGWYQSPLSHFQIYKYTLEIHWRWYYLVRLYRVTLRLQIEVRNTRQKYTEGDIS